MNVSLKSEESERKGVKEINRENETVDADNERESVCQTQCHIQNSSENSTKFFKVYVRIHGTYIY